ncbi:hypothetical protein M2137_002015 [Parabacteroides sp. PFB2-10]|nr:hypothetical protein [Parabacteroides sp. PFB2-10]
MNPSKSHLGNSLISEIPVQTKYHFVKIAGLFFRKPGTLEINSREKHFLTYHIVKQNGVFAYILSNGICEEKRGAPKMFST